MTQTFVNQVKSTLLLTLQNGEQVETTGGHRFALGDGDWQKAKFFGVGTSIITRAGPKQAIAKIEEKKHKQLKTIYNFEVEGTHTYFVGKSQLWAHNDRINYDDYDDYDDDPAPVRNRAEQRKPGTLGEFGDNVRENTQARDAARAGGLNVNDADVMGKLHKHIAEAQQQAG